MRTVFLVLILITTVSYAKRKCLTENSYCVNDTVTFENKRGYITYIDPETGTCDIRVRGKDCYENYMGLNPEKLALGTKSTCSSKNKSYCVGSKIIYIDIQGKIIGVYPSGELSVKFEKYGIDKKRFSPEDLALANRPLCSNKHELYCIGYEVRYKGKKGIIVGVDTDGKVALKIGKRIIGNRFDPSMLALSTRNSCSLINKLFCVGVQISYYGTKGVITGVYPSGKLSVKLGNLEPHIAFNPSWLSLEPECSVKNNTLYPAYIF